MDAGEIKRDEELIKFVQELNTSRPRNWNKIVKKTSTKGNIDQ